MAENKTSKKSTNHHNDTDSYNETFLHNVTNLKKVFEELGSPFEEIGSDLVSLDTKEVATTKAVENLRKLKKVGDEQFKAFTKERLTDVTKSLDEKISKNNFKIFGEKKGVTVSKDKQKMSTIKNDSNIVSQLFKSCQTRQGDLDEFFAHENMEYPPSLSNNGDINSGNKSDLLSCLEDVTISPDNNHQSTCIILDGAVIVQMLKPGSVKTFDQYANTTFIPYIVVQAKKYKRVDLVWDSYLENSLKARTREKRGSGIRKHVSGSTMFPSNWPNFLKVDENKEELFNFLSHKSLNHFRENSSSEIIVTVKDSAESSNIFSVWSL